MKIVVIGAGSRNFGLRCVADVLVAPGMREFSPELALVDIDREKLESMRSLALMLKEHLRSPAAISATRDREEALAGADYVLVSVTRRRYELWEQDYRVPYAYGFPQPYAENGGPGALFHAMRNIHLILPICRDMERLCPNALLFNYSNPESRVLLAMRTLTGIRAIGLCHGQHGTRELICRYLNRQDDEIETLGAGINHFFWLYSVTDRKTGEDLYPRVRRAAAADADPHHALMKKMLDIYGLITYPHSTHVGEFVQFGTEFTGCKWPHGLESRSVDAPHHSTADGLAPYLRKEKPLSEIAVQSGEMGVPMILAHAQNKRARFIAGNVLNDGLYVPNLLPDGIVEVPVEVDGEGIHPVKVPPLPEGLAAFCRTQMAIQKLTVEAYRQRSKNLLLQTLLLEPVVNSVSNAEQLIEDMLQLQAAYVPEFK